MKSRVETSSSLSLNAPEAENVALCAALDLPDADVPEWVHLLPAGPTIATYDGRGPWLMDDPAAIVANSMQLAGERGAIIDENHATDLAAPRGEPAPARGRITEFEARADGIWGKVQWTPTGKGLLAERAYKGLSPVLELQRGTNRVVSINRASLVNRGNIKNLQSLNQQESGMDFLAKLRAQLKLADSVSEDAVLAAVTTLQGDAARGTTALNAQATIAKAAGLKGDETAEVIAGAVAELKKSPAATGTVEALQAEITSMAAEITTLRTGAARDKAVAFIDQAIKDQRMGLPPALRDTYISMHMEDAARTELLVNGMPKAVKGSIIPAAPPPKDGEVSLNAEQASVTKMLGLDPEKVKATIKREHEAIA